MAEIKNPEVFTQEIADLEAKLAAKKLELASSGTESSEKTIFKQVVKEHAGGESFQPSMPVHAATAPAAATTAVAVTPAVTAKLNTFIAHAFTKGIADAIKEAKKTNDAYFVDLLHDRLADEYYQKLIQARKINQT